MSKIIILFISFVMSIQISNALILPHTIGVMGGGAMFAFIVYPIVFIITMTLLSYAGISLYNHFSKE